MKAVIFDMDNTLVATDEYVLCHILETASFLSIDVSTDDIKNVLKKNLDFEDLFHELFRQDAPIMLEHYRATAKQRHYTALPHVKEFLSSLKPIIITGILTNRVKMAEERLSQAGLSGFSFIISPQEKKPSPGSFNEVLALLSEKGLSKEDAVYIGDHIHDYLAAKSASIPFYAVTTGSTTRTEFLDAGLDDMHILNDMMELKIDG